MSNFRTRFFFVFSLILALSVAATPASADPPKDPPKNQPKVGYNCVQLNGRACTLPEVKADDPCKACKSTCINVLDDPATSGITVPTTHSECVCSTPPPATLKNNTTFWHYETVPAKGYSGDITTPETSKVQRTTLNFNKTFKRKPKRIAAKAPKPEQPQVGQGTLVFPNWNRSDVPPQYFNIPERPPRTITEGLNTPSIPGHSITGTHSVGSLRFCPVCRKTGQKSSIHQSPVVSCPAVYSGPQVTWDENGVQHYTEGSPVPCEREYRCSLGHTWREKE